MCLFQIRKGVHFKYENLSLSNTKNASFQIRECVIFKKKKRIASKYEYFAIIKCKKYIIFKYEK